MSQDNFFSHPQALDRVQHRQLRLAPRQPYHYAANQMLVPVVFSEIDLIAREYVIAFGHQQGSLPLALLGTAPKSNAYVNAEGYWSARYVPAHVRRYPFVLARSKEVDPQTGQSSFYLMFDADAPHLSNERGAALFDDAGQPSEVLQTVQKVLVSLEQDGVRTQKLVDEIEQAGLLVARQVRVQTKGEDKPVVLDGLRMVDADKLAALAPQVLQQLQQSGALRLIYAHLISLSNLRDGALATEKRAAAPVAADSDGSISFDGIDWSKFH